MGNAIEMVSAGPDLDAIAKELYSQYLGVRGSVEKIPVLPDNATPDQKKVFADTMWYWNVDKDTYSISYVDRKNESQTLYGYYLKNGGSNKTAVVVHGLTGFAAEMGVWAKMYFDLGYNIFTPDLRGHGRSTENSINYGALDSADLVKWVDVCCDNAPTTEEFLFFGISMGALAVLAGASKLPDGRKGMLSSLAVDSAFDNAKLLLEAKFLSASELAGLTAYEKIVVYEKINSLFKENQGARFDDLLTPDDIRKLSLPVLIVHGTNDSLDTLKVPYKIFADVDTNQKQYFLIAGAGHAQCFAVDYDGYKETVTNFITRRELAPLMSGYNKWYLYVLRLISGDESIDLPVMDSLDGDLSNKVVISGIDFSKAGNYSGEASVMNSRGVEGAKKLRAIVIGAVTKTEALTYTLGDPSVYLVYPYDDSDILMFVLSVWDEGGSAHGEGPSSSGNNLAIFNVSDGRIYSVNTRVEATVAIHTGDVDTVRVPIVNK
jgi:pimeloyl-ACP methyl ester carboxylesterase